MGIFLIPPSNITSMFNLKICRPTYFVAFLVLIILWYPMALNSNFERMIVHRNTCGFIVRHNGTIIMIVITAFSLAFILASTYILFIAISSILILFSWWHGMCFDNSPQNNIVAYIRRVLLRKKGLLLILYSISCVKFYLI